MAILIYKLTNRESGKSYVGMTSRSLETRWLEHCARARQGVRNGRLYDAIRKYGMDCFDREVLATADTEDEGRSLETALICQHDTYLNGYNANEGGCGLLSVSEDIRSKIGAAQRGKVISPECKAKMSAAKKANPSSEHLGNHLAKGASNPRAGKFLIRYPDGETRSVVGLRAFCRETGAHMRHLKLRGHSLGYALLGKDI